MSELEMIVNGLVPWDEHYGKLAKEQLKELNKEFHDYLSMGIRIDELTKENEQLRDIVEDTALTDGNMPSDIIAREAAQKWLKNK
jgi:hypothetical protein